MAHFKYDREVTCDIRDGDETHVETLVWNDLEGKWLEMDDPLAGLSALDGGFIRE